MQHEHINIVGFLLRANRIILSNYIFKYYQVKKTNKPVSQETRKSYFFFWQFIVVSAYCQNHFALNNCTKIKNASISQQTTLSSKVYDVHLQRCLNEQDRHRFSPKWQYTIKTPSHTKNLSQISIMIWQTYFTNYVQQSNIYTSNNLCIWRGDRQVLSHTQSSCNESQKEKNSNQYAFIKLMIIQA